MAWSICICMMDSMAWLPLFWCFCFFLKDTLFYFFPIWNTFWSPSSPIFGKTGRSWLSELVFFPGYSASWYPDIPLEPEEYIFHWCLPCRTRVSSLNLEFYSEASSGTEKPGASSSCCGTDTGIGKLGEAFLCPSLLLSGSLLSSFDLGKAVYRLPVPVSKEIIKGWVPRVIWTVICLDVMSMCLPSSHCQWPCSISHPNVFLPSMVHFFGRAFFPDHSLMCSQKAV